MEVTKNYSRQPFGTLHSGSGFASLNTEYAVLCIAFVLPNLLTDVKYSISVGVTSPILERYMYLADILNRYQYTAEEFGNAYLKKMNHNLKRDYSKSQTQIIEFYFFVPRAHSISF
ncbi:MAG: hypothetical protein ABIB61_02030 [Candidatus Shapirobacteria bacterium]